MKNLVTTLVLAALVLTTTIEAGSKNTKYSEKYLKKAEVNSIATMESNINSLVESTIFNMIVFKANIPDWKFDSIVDALNDLSTEGKTASIRYKAQLASLYITYPQLFTNIEVSGKDNANDLFKSIANRIETDLVASN